MLAYDGDEADERQGPVGWCSIAPRESYAAVLASRVIPQLPGERVWSVVCFFVAPRARRRGLRTRVAGRRLRLRGRVRRRRDRGLPVARREGLPLHGHPRAVPRGRLRGGAGAARRPSRHAQASVGNRA